MTDSEIKKLCGDSYNRGRLDALELFRDLLYMMLAHVNQQEKDKVSTLTTVITEINKNIKTLRWGER